MANRQFAELDERLVLLVEDTRDGVSDFAKSYQIRNNCAGFVLLDASATEIGRNVSYRNETFDEAMLEQIDEMVRGYLDEQDRLARYVLTMIGVQQDAESEFERQMNLLSSDHYATRDRATRALVKMGEPAYQRIESGAANDIETRAIESRAS